MNTNTKRILVIEDNREVWETLTDLFKNDRSYKFTFVDNGEHGGDLLLQGTFDLAIVDLGLPGKSGREVIIDARRFGFKKPILVLTANKDSFSESDNIDDGANDYVTKPFKNHVLVSRIKRLLRDSMANAEAVIQHGRFTFDTFHNAVSGDGFATFILPNNPARILETLMRSRRILLESWEIIRNVWGNDGQVNERTLGRNVNRLNEAFERNGLGQIVNTVRGRGYELVRE